MLIPGPPVLIYDGDCEFCTRCVRWAASRWPSTGSPLARASQDLDDVSLAAMSLTRGDVMRAAWWIDGASAFEGHLAVAKALASCRGVWRVIGVCLAHWPLRWLGAITYPVVVRHRALLTRGPAKCSLR